MNVSSVGTDADKVQQSKVTDVLLETYLGQIPKLAIYHIFAPSVFISDSRVTASKLIYFLTFHYKHSVCLTTAVSLNL